MTSRRTQRGFTLLETIVVLVIVGFIGAALAEGTRFGLAASRTADRWVAHDDASATAERVLRGLVTDAVAGDGANDASSFIGAAHSLAFTTMLTVPPPGLHVAAADVAIAVERTSLVLRLTPRYPGAALAAPHAIELVLADHVAGLDVSYWAAGDHGTEWRRSWTADGLPLLVRLRILPAPGSGILPAPGSGILPAAGSRMPAWPDIVAGPFRMQMPS